jgi:hypothetical protein
MKVELEQLELSTIVASLGKSRHYFECVRKDQDTADSLQQIRLKLIKQGRMLREDFRIFFFLFQFAFYTQEISCLIDLDLKERYNIVKKG